ncbi:MAG: hypothetical protein WAX38_03625 [Minisyncoccia bacterium]
MDEFAEAENAHQDLNSANLDFIGMVGIINWIIDFLPFDNILNVFTSGALIVAVIHLKNREARSTGIRGMLIATLMGVIPLVEWIPAEFIARHMIRKTVKQAAESL